MSYGYRNYGYMTKQDGDQIRRHCDNRWAWRNSSGHFTGEAVNDWGRRHLPNRAGLLPEPWLRDLRERKVDYIVRSYNTIIGYHSPRGWTVPTVHYSATTANHQSQLRRALGIQPDDAWPDDQDALWPVVA